MPGPDPTSPPSRVACEPADRTTGDRGAGPVATLPGVDAPVGEDPGYLSRQLITCIGNKRALLPEIAAAVDQVRSRLGRERLRIFEPFAGSGVVSRLLKSRASRLVVSDLEDFAVAAARCYLRNRAEVDWAALDRVLQGLDARAAETGEAPGVFEELYAPADEARITRRDRVFYTKANARRLDRYCRALGGLTPEIRDLCLGPLLSAASVHANTAGVFKGFYKDRATGIGRFGGSGGDALGRILGTIRLERPVLSRYACDVDVRQGDANEVARAVEDVDLAYLDPPYNQHPYGSNYFMLNLIVGYRRPDRVSRVSGIPVDWRRSDYNVRARALERLADLIGVVPARCILLSFNDEGFVSRAELEDLLRRHGQVGVVERSYHAFRGSRNLRARRSHVTEQLFLVDRGAGR